MSKILIPHIILDTSPRKRKSFTVQEKIWALDKLKNGKHVAQLAREMHINESTLRGWRKEEDKLRGNRGLMRKKVKTASDGNLDDRLYKWVVEARGRGCLISGPVLRAAAERLDREINGLESTFRASNGWLDRFKKRHAIVLDSHGRARIKEINFL